MIYCSPALGGEQSVEKKNMVAKIKNLNQSFENKIEEIVQKTIRRQYKENSRKIYILIQNVGNMQEIVYLN